MEMQNMEDLCSLYSTLLTAAKSEVNGDLANVDTQELGAVVDMVKDLAEAKKDCLKACYYKTVIEAMTNSDEYGVRGYHGRKRLGHEMSELYWPDEPHNEELEHSYRLGYRDDRMSPMIDDPRYGMAYNEYRIARKHYTETHSAADKEEMEHHITEHVSDTISTMMDIYRAADPELKKRIKADFSKLVTDMV